MCLHLLPFMKHTFLHILEVLKSNIKNQEIRRDLERSEEIENYQINDRRIFLRSAAHAFQTKRVYWHPVQQIRKDPDQDSQVPWWFRW